MGFVNVFLFMLLMIVFDLWNTPGLYERLNVFCEETIVLQVKYIHRKAPGGSYVSLVSFSHKGRSKKPKIKQEGMKTALKMSQVNV